MLFSPLIILQIMTYLQKVQQKWILGSFWKEKEFVIAEV